MARSRNPNNRLPEPPGDPRAGLNAMLDRLEARTGFKLKQKHMAIGDNETLRQWAERLGRDGLKVDGKPFSLADRPTLAFVYDQAPSTREEARQAMLMLRKCAQVGFTIFQQVLAIYLALKFEPLVVGVFLPTVALARGISSARFLPIVRTIPEAYERLVAGDGGEGNVLMRQMGASTFHFLPTSGKATTESYPMDVICFDEVQEMLIADMEKTAERLSASNFKFILMGSTANWPDADIDYWYKRGSQWRFHTRCPQCGVEEPLDDYFPDCIAFDPTHPDRVTGELGDYRYVCRAGHWIDDSQQGTWLPDNPDADLRKIKSIHFHQMLSPTISPRELFEAWVNADDRKNFYNRKLGKPYQDPSQVPVTLAHLNACVAEGLRCGVTWKTGARSTVMGIDQMGAFNVAIIKEALPDGRQAVIHVEEIYADDPFGRCDRLMNEFGVQVCVVEQLPNYNDAHRFANRHQGRVFLASYGDLRDDMLIWGDGPRLDASERRTSTEERDRYKVTIDQYRAMQVSLERVVDTKCLFPDPQALVQQVREKGGFRLMPVLKDRVFLHLQKTALVTEPIRPGERKLRRKVIKVGIDPHFAFANMLCDIAWARADRNAMFIFSESQTQPTVDRVTAIQAKMPGLPGYVLAMFDDPSEGEFCGGCTAFQDGVEGRPLGCGFCPERRLFVQARDRGCPLWVGKED